MSLLSPFRFMRGEGGGVSFYCFKAEKLCVKAVVRPGGVKQWLGREENSGIVEGCLCVVAVENKRRPPYL